VDDKPDLRKTLALEPLGAPTSGGTGSGVVGVDASGEPKEQHDLRMTTSDEFLSKAAREYQKGHVDQALWRRAANQGGKDDALVVAAYLRNRATALQLKHKLDERSQIKARGAGSKRAASDLKVESGPPAEIVSTKFVGAVPKDPKPKLTYLAAAGAALVAAIVVVYLLVSPGESESVRHPMASGATATPNQSATPGQAGKEEAEAKSTTPGIDPDAPIATTVQQLKDAGKWNVLVLYATEWTRREPGSAAAWNELSLGFARLQQYGDALDAATKAVQLAPGDALMWRNLGHLDLDVDRLPEAGVAFAKALALRPDDPDARCSAAVVAQRQTRPKDAATTIVQAKAGDSSCPDERFGERTVTAKDSPAARKPASPPGH
jgi:Flp pilus assembly protein TadD